jgi:hypothetical protein
MRENSWCVAHNPEVAGWNPVPTTSETAPGERSGPVSMSEGADVVKACDANLP